MEGAEVTVAAVDIGSNTVRLLVIDGAEGTELVRRTDVVGLGRGVDATGRLSDEAMRRCLDVLATYRETIETLGVTRTRAVGTSAMRDAANGEQFLDQAEQTLGTRPDVVAGEEEALLAFRGSTHDLHVTGPVLVIDPGGGSTEFVYGEEDPEYVVSIDIGSVRLTDRLLPDRPATAAQVAAAVEHVRQILTAVHLPGAPDEVFGVAATFASLSAINQALDRYDRDAVHRSRLSVVDMESLIDRLSSLTVEETAAIPSLDPARAPVLLAGAVVACEAARISGHDAVTVSESDLLDGIALSMGR